MSLQSKLETVRALLLDISRDDLCDEVQTCDVPHKVRYAVDDLYTVIDETIPALQMEIERREERLGQRERDYFIAQHRQRLCDVV